MNRAVATALLALSGCLETPAAARDASPPVAADAAACTEPCCPAGQLVDDFDGDPSGAFAAETTDEGCQVVEELGAVWLANTTTDAACDYETTRLWRLAGQSASIEVVEAGDGAPNLQFRTELSSGEKFFFERRPTGFRAARINLVGETEEVVPDATFQPYLQRYWRFTGDDESTALYLEFAGDDLEWHPLTTVLLQTPGTSECVEFELATRGPAGAGADDRVAYDNFNGQ